MQNNLKKHVVVFRNVWILVVRTIPIAQKISKKSLMTIKTGKEAFYKQYEMSLSDAYEYTSMVMVQNTLRDDAKEGISSFIEKRDPNWQDN